MKLARVLLASGVGMLVASAAAMAGPLLSVGPTQGVPGSTVNVPVNFTTDTSITGVNFDLLFNTNYLQIGTVVGGSALPPDEFLGTNLIAPGQFRVLVISFFDTPMNDGVVVYMPFTIATNAPDHDEPLALTNVDATDVNGLSVPLFTSNSVLAIIVPPKISQIARTNGVIHLALTGSTNRNYFIQATTNLAAPQWLSFTNVLAGSNAVFEDITAPNFPIRFYRALVAQ